MAGLVAELEQEKNADRKDRFYDLSRSLLDISQRLRDTYETTKVLLPQDDASKEHWKKAVSEKGIHIILKAYSDFEDFLFPAGKVGEEMNIPELFYRRFLVRKLELELRGVLVCIKDALLAVATIRVALNTYDDLEKSGTFTGAVAKQGKQKVLAEFHSVEIEAPNIPSNKTIFEELHQRDITTKVYMDEDPHV